jgi:hypothetical protein
VKGSRLRQDAGSWLEGVPTVDEAHVQIEGRLTACSRAEVAVFVERERLCFASEDVLRVVLPEGSGQLPTRGILHLRRGAMLLSATPAEGEVGTARRPFALCVRPRHTRIEAAPGLRALERQFLSRQGITAELGSD